MASEWFVQHGGKQYGPMTSANLKKLAADGKIKPATSVRMGADGNWAPASRVQGLFSAAQLAATPPVSASSVAKAKPVPAPPPPPVQAPPIVAAPLARKAIPKPVAVEPAGLGAKVIGAVAMILALVALATCWLIALAPGSAIGWTGIAIGALGLVLGILGLVVAAKSKGHGLMWNVGGAGGSAVGLVLSIVLGAMFGLFSAPTPAPMPNMVAQHPPEPEPVFQAMPVDAEPEVVAPPEIEWFDAGDMIQIGDIRASIVAASIEQVRLESVDLSTLKAQKPQPMLKVKVMIENVSLDRIIQVPGWPGGSDLLGAGLGELLGSAGGELGQLVKANVGATLIDNVGNKYPQTPQGMLFGGALTSPDNSVRPGANKLVELIFPPPLATIEYLRLELPTAGFSGELPIRFQIRKALITGM